MNNLIEIITRKYNGVVKVQKTVSYLDDGSWWWFEVFNKSCSKSRGLKDICSIFNLSLEEAAYIGDNYNDIEAMEVAGMSIAVDNAPEDIKRICDYVVASNNENGVAEAIEMILERNV